MAGLLTLLVHPDDETMLAALLFALKKKNVDIHLAVITRGEGGRFGNPPLATKENIAMVREIEMKAAAFVLQSKSLYFFDVEDPTPSINLEGKRMLAAPHISYSQFKERMTTIVEIARPEAIITHGSNGEYGHPGHMQTGEHCRKYISEEMNNSIPLYTMAAHDPSSDDKKSNQDDIANYFLDKISYQDQCFELLKCHLCQHLSFAGDIKNTDPNFLNALRKASNRKKKEAYKFWTTHTEDVLLQWLSDELHS